MDLVWVPYGLILLLNAETQDTLLELLGRKRHVGDCVCWDRSLFREPGWVPLSLFEDLVDAVYVVSIVGAPSCKVLLSARRAELEHGPIRVFALYHAVFCSDGICRLYM